MQTEHAQSSIIKSKKSQGKSKMNLNLILRKFFQFVLSLLFISMTLFYFSVLLMFPLAVLWYAIKIAPLLTPTVIAVLISLGTLGYLGLTVSKNDTAPPQPPTYSDKLTSHDQKARQRILLAMIISASLYDFVAKLLNWNIGFGIFWVWAAVIILISLDGWLLHFRVKQGWYGSNAMEAAELVRFIEKMTHDGNDGDNYRILPKWKPSSNDNGAVAPKDRMAV